MRGIVSLAAALALPVSINDGTPFPYRDLIIFLTFVVIAVTLVVQGLTLPALIRRLKMAEDVSAKEEHRRAQHVDPGVAVVDDPLGFILHHAVGADGPGRGLGRIAHADRAGGEDRLPQLADVLVALHRARAGEP